MLSKNVCCFLIGGFVLLAICGLSFGQADQPLVAIIDASPISGPAPLSVVFDASRSTGDIMTAYWEFGDGGYAYGKRVVHTYNVQGTYVATLTVYDPAGNSAFASVTITVLQPAGQPPILTLYDPQINGLTVTINGVTQPGTPGTTITRIHWIWGDGSEGDYWFPASHTYREAGRYRIIVISFQSDGLSTASSVTVTLSEPRPSQPPSLDLFTPEIQGLTVRINGVALPGTPGTVISRIHWDWGDGSRGDQWFAASHTYASPGTYTVTVTAFQSDGLSTTRTVTVRLAGSQPPSLTLFNPEIRGLTVTINGVTSPGTPGTTIVRIQWDWGDGIREDRWFAASHTYSRPGTYTITVSSFQSDGLSTTRTVTVSLKEENKPPVADFSYSPSNPRVNETIQFTDRSYDPDGSITSWRWEFGDGSTSTLSNPSHSYSRPGTYTVWLYVTDNGGAAARASKTITIGEANRPPYEPSNPYPPHRATEIPIDISLSWSSGDPDGDPVTYDIYFGTSSPLPLIARGHSSSTYRLPKLDYNTKYYWSITASDGKVSTRGPTWEFTTGARIKRLERLAIYGPTEVQGVSGNTVSYSCTAYFDDGTQEDVTNSATWGESFDSATISRGRLTVTSDLTSTQRGEVTCSYTYNAVAKSASLSVTLLAIAQDSIFRGIILVDRPIISFYSFDISIQTILSDPSGKLRVGDVITVGGHRDSPAKVDLVAVGDLVEVKGVVVSGPEGYGVQLTEARHYVKRIGTQGNLAYFDLDYRGSPPNSDGNEQRSITAQPGAPLTLFFRYNEGNVGNQYVVRVYAEWDRTRPIANSDNDETISEVGAEIGGYRWDKEAYTAPSTPGTYKVRVVYSASATPPTWDRYDKLLAEGTITVSQPQLIATELSILLEPSMIQEGTDRVIVVKGRLVRKDNMQGIAGKKIDIFFSDWPKTAVTDSNGYYQTEYAVNLRAGSYEFTASFAGDNQYSASRATATLTVVRVEPLKPDLTITDIWWEPKEVYEGDEVMFYYIEKNQGSVASGDFGSAIYVDGQRICISARGSLAPGESRERFCSYRWKAMLGEHTVVVEADWAKEVDEANENNNKLEKKLGVIQAKQVVEIVSVSTDKELYYIGEPVTVTVKIKNTGNVAVSGLRINVDIADPPGRKVKEGVFEDGISLAIGEEKTFSKTYWTVPSDALVGTYTVTAGLHGVPYVEKKTSFEVKETTIPIPAVSGYLEAPLKVAYDYPFWIEATIKNGGGRTAYIVEFALEAPSGFRICERGRNTIYIGDLKPGESRTYSICVVAPRHQGVGLFTGTISYSDNPWGQGTSMEGPISPCKVEVERGYVITFILYALPLVLDEGWVTVYDSSGNYVNTGGGVRPSEIDPVRIQLNLLPGQYTAVAAGKMENIPVFGKAQFSVEKDGSVNIILTPFIPLLAFTATCPVDLIVTDPDGLIIDKRSSQIPGATYTEVDLNGDGDLDVQIIIPDPKMGDYQVRVVPKPQAKPTDTYTLEVTTSGKTKILAREQQIKDIPATPYIFTSTGASLPPGGKTIETALDTNGNGILDDDEILRALQYWISGEEVPGTDGQTIDDAKMLELVHIWASRRPISSASAQSEPIQARRTESLTVKEIKLSPNPVKRTYTATFRAEGSGIAGIKVEVFNLKGMRVSEQEASGNTLRFYTVDNRGRPLANGVYLYVVRVRGFDGREYVSAVRKLVIVR
jgi:PKD repeat protein